MENEKSNTENFQLRIVKPQLFSRIGVIHRMKNSIRNVIVLAIGVASVSCIIGCSKRTKPDTAADLPHFALAPGDIVSSVEVVTNGAGQVEVQFRLSDAKADELLAWTKKTSRASVVEISVGSTAIMKPGMQSVMAISNGVVRVFSPSSDSSDVRAIGESLKRK